MATAAAALAPRRWRACPVWVGQMGVMGGGGHGGWQMADGRWQMGGQQREGAGVLELLGAGVSGVRVTGSAVLEFPWRCIAMKRARRMCGHHPSLGQYSTGAGYAASAWRHTRANGVIVAGACRDDESAPWPGQWAR